MEELVQYQLFKEGYGLIRLNRPQKHNAISREMADLFLEKLKNARNNDIKFLIITGAGQKMFCSGGDLNHLHGDLSSDEAFKELYPMKECLYELVSFPVPTVCLLNGDALGGGCEIATACDFRIGKKGTKFGFVQSKLGIIPGWGGGELLYKKVHPSFAYRWLLGADIFDIDYLEKQGWIHRIVDIDNWENHHEILEPFLSKSIEQMKYLKKQYNTNLSVLSLSAQMNEEVQSSAILWESPEHKEAVERFFKEK